MIKVYCTQGHSVRVIKFRDVVNIRYEFVSECNGRIPIQRLQVQKNTTKTAFLEGSKGCKWLSRDEGEKIVYDA